MRRFLIRVFLLTVSTVICAVGGELVYRWWLEPSPNLGELYYADDQRVELDLQTPEGMAKVHEYIGSVPDAIRGRTLFVPNSTLHICYRGMEGKDGYDELGCVPYSINSWGVRDREELCRPKPQGQRRVVCIGDSTTIGWGVRVEDSWVRRTEVELRQTDDNVRLVNCGAAGALYPDEYADQLIKRFGKFDPDVVLVTFCMNDLLPVNAGMLHFTTPYTAPDSWTWPLDNDTSHFVRDLRTRLSERDRLTAPVGVNVVDELLALPTEKYTAAGLKEVGRIFWDSGVPQAAIGSMREECARRGARLAVAIWPFCQALSGTREAHPFARMHDLVVAHCADQGIPVLDLLDDFLGRDARSLWITPKDAHGNQETHAIAAPRYAEFLRSVLAGDE